MAVIEAHNLSYIYEEGQETAPILKDVNFAIHAGEMVAITGPSGSGKSTLLYLLAGMLKGQSGEISVEGLNLNKLSKQQLALLRSQKIGFVFQDAYLLPRTTVLDNILLPTLYPSELITPKDDYRKQALEYIDHFGLGHRIHHFPNELSRGEQQRVAIARSLIRGSKIIFADEPTGSLDDKTSTEIIDCLHKLKKEKNLAILLVTHDLRIAESADREFVLRNANLLPHNTEKKSVNSAQPRSATKPIVKEVELKKIKKLPGLITSIFKLFPVAAKNIFRNRARSLLTMLGIVIGIAAMLTMLTLGQFTKSKILATYTTLGANTLAIHGYPKANSHNSNGELTFTAFNIENDIKPLTKIFPQITMMSPVLYNGGINVIYAGKKIANEAITFGVGKDYLNIVGRKTITGRDLITQDFQESHGACIIGYDIARYLPTGIKASGTIINLKIGENYFACPVVGVLNKISSGKVGMYNQNSQIILPYTFYRRIITDPWSSQVRSVLARVKSVAYIQPLGKAIQQYFNTKYGVTGSFTVDRNIALLAQMRKFFNLFTLMLAAIAAIALLIGGIGITNMMLISVTEQLKEIGLRKALGATDSSMKIQFLIEAIIICLIGGVIGLISGFIFYEAVIYAVAKFMHTIRFEWLISPFAMSLAFISIFAVGILSGMIPARKAESLDIVTALRSE